MSLRLAGVLAVLLAALLALVTGCGVTASSAGTNAPTRKFTADNGTVTIPAEPKRVVATGYAVPVLIEAGAPLVAISKWDRTLDLMSRAQRATYDRLPKVANDLSTELTYDAIVKADPDLILIGVPKPVLGKIDLNKLGDIAPVVAIGPAAPDDWREKSRLQAEAANRLGKFDEIKQAYERKAAALTEKYSDALRGLKFGHVGGYGDASAGSFQREFAGSFGTNVAGDIGVRYYGQVMQKGPGGQGVSEYVSLEDLSASLGEADAITYTLEPDGSVGSSVKSVLDSPLWPALPAVKAGMVFPVRHTQAATYSSAMSTLDSLDETLAPLLKR